MASGGQTDDVMWERKYFVLQKHCQEIEQVSAFAYESFPMTTFL